MYILIDMLDNDRHSYGIFGAEKMAVADPFPKTIALGSNEKDIQALLHDDVQNAHHRILGDTLGVTHAEKALIERPLFTPIIIESADQLKEAIQNETIAGALLCNSFPLEDWYAWLFNRKMRKLLESWQHGPMGRRVHVQWNGGGTPGWAKDLNMSTAIDDTEQFLRDLCAPAEIAAYRATVLSKTKLNGNGTASATSVEKALADHI